MALNKAAATAVLLWPRQTLASIGVTPKPDFVAKWAIARLANWRVGMSLYVTANTLVRSAARPKLVELTVNSSRLDAALSIARRGGYARVCVMDCGVALLGKEFLREVLTYHTLNRNGMTWVAGLPIEHGIEIFDRLSVECLRKLLPTEDMRNARSVFSAVARASPDAHTQSLVRAQPMLAPSYLRLAPGLMDDFPTFELKYQCELLRDLTNSAEISVDANILPAWRAERNRHMNNWWRKQRATRLPPLKTTDKSRTKPAISKRVLFVTGSIGFTGGEHMLSTLISGVQARGWRTTLLARRDGPLQRQVTSAGTALVLDDEAALASGLRSAQRAEAVLDDIRPDLIHLNGLCNPFLVASAVRRGVPLVQHVRVVDNPELEHQIRAASHVIAISEFVAGEVLRLGLTTETVTRIYNGFALERLQEVGGDRTRERRRRGVSARAWVVGMVARYAQNKRHGFLFEAIARAVAQIPTIHVMLLGDPATEPDGYREALAMARATGVEQRLTEVHFTEDMKAFYSACDAVALCSVREPFGNCVCEAMAVGRPLVVSGSGGYLEVVKNDETALVRNGSDPAAFCAALVQLARSTPTRDRLVANARAQINQARWSADRYVNEVIAVYEKVTTH